jgi:hypothetical protein
MASTLFFGRKRMQRYNKDFYPASFLRFFFEKKRIFSYLLTKGRNSMEGGDKIGRISTIKTKVCFVLFSICTIFAVKTI